MCTVAYSWPADHVPLMIFTCLRYRPCLVSCLFQCWYHWGEIILQFDCVFLREYTMLGRYY